MSAARLWQTLPHIQSALAEHRLRRLQRWISRLHPWGSAALAVKAGSPWRALKQLQHWRRHGLAASDLAAITQAAAHWFPLLQQNRSHWPIRPGAVTEVRVWAPSEPTWLAEAWQQHLPQGCTSEATLLLPPLAERLSPLWPKQCWIGLHLQDLQQSAAEHQLVPLASLEAVFDPNSAQVELLRRLGVNAHVLQPRTAQPAEAIADGLAASQELGLPPPSGLLSPGATSEQPPAVIVLGSSGAEWERSLESRTSTPAIWCIPRFAELELGSTAKRRALVGWLNGCQQLGMQLVQLGSSSANERLATAALLPPHPTPPGWLPLQWFRDPIDAEQLLSELQWRQQRQSPSADCHTPQPAHTVLWHSTASTQPCRVSVCISLFNYGERITAALESVRCQSQSDLELIVVDDHSSDGGEQVVQSWLEQHQRSFSRTLLVRHQSNGGLAAARNTAFAKATSSWCFVLDADNHLLPRAVELCLRIAEASDARTAVVHPLVEVVAEAGRYDPRSLLGGVSWQKEQFIHGNVVDAMALVRRSAWDAVGGYTHIPGGWEDFDFWCKLMEAGWHGVLCPQPLATYVVHGESMLQACTNLQKRQLKRILQARHPWLALT